MKCIFLSEFFCFFFYLLRDEKIPPHVILFVLHKQRWVLNTVTTYFSTKKSSILLYFSRCFHFRNIPLRIAPTHIIINHHINRKPKLMQIIVWTIMVRLYYCICFASWWIMIYYNLCSFFHFVVFHTGIGVRLVETFDDQIKNNKGTQCKWI